jgi:hypothetical protein
MEPEGFVYGKETPMSDAPKNIEDQRLLEVARHRDLWLRMSRIDGAAARRAVRAAVSADPAMTFSQACTWSALRLRLEVELMPKPAMPTEAGRDLRIAVAYTLETMANAYPETERLHPRFRFEVAPADPRFGRARLDVLAVEFERTFADAGGALRLGYDAATVDRLAAALREPRSAEFFDLIGTDVTMAGFAVSAYAMLADEDPRRRLAPVFRSHHPDAAERADAAIAMALELAGLRSEPAPSFAPG